MAKGSKSVRFSDSALEHINNYPTSFHGEIEFTSKLEEIIEASKALYEITKLELKGVFTVGEACLIVDVNNSHLYSPKIHPKSGLALCISDGDKYEGLGEKWDVNIPKLLEIINKLSNYQCHCIFLMCNEFWNMDHDKRNEKPIQETVSEIFKTRK